MNSWEGDTTETPPAYSTVDSSETPSLRNLAALDGTRGTSHSGSTSSDRYMTDAVPTSHPARNDIHEIENSDASTHPHNVSRVFSRRSRSSRSSRRRNIVLHSRPAPLLRAGSLSPPQTRTGHSGTPPTVFSSFPSSDFTPTESESGDFPPGGVITEALSLPPLGCTPIFIGFPIEVLKQLPMYRFPNLSYGPSVTPYAGVISTAYSLWHKASIDFFDWRDVNYDVIYNFLKCLYEQNSDNLDRGVLDLARISLVFYTPYNLNLARVTHLLRDMLSIDEMIFCFPPLDKAFGTLKFNDNISVDWFHCSEGPNPTLKPGCYCQTMIDGVSQTPRVCEWSSDWLDTRFMGTDAFLGLVPKSGCSGDLFPTSSTDSTNFDFQFYCAFRPVLGALYLSSIDGSQSANSLRESKFGVGTQVSIHNGVVVPSFITFTQFVCCTQNNFMTRTLGTIIKSQLMASPMHALVLVSNDTYVEDLRIIAYERIQNFSRQFLRNSGAISRSQDYVERILSVWYTLPGGWFDQRELYRNWNTSVMRTYGTSQRLGSIIDTKSWHSYLKKVSGFAMFMILCRYSRKDLFSLLMSVVPYLFKFVVHTVGIGRLTCMGELDLTNVTNSVLANRTSQLIQWALRLVARTTKRSSPGL